MAFVADFGTQNVKLKNKFDMENNTSTKQENGNDANRLLPAVFVSGADKVEQFKREFKELLVKYDAEIEIQDFSRNWQTDEKIVVNFNWDEDLANRTNDGIVPDWVVGRWENGR